MINGRDTKTETLLQTLPKLGSKHQFKDPCSASKSRDNRCETALPLLWSASLGRRTGLRASAASGARALVRS